MRACPSVARMNPQFSVYLAGPDVFSPDARDQLAIKMAICERMGLRALIPIDNDTLPEGSPRDQAMAIYRGNLGKMEQADAVIANITPFRGPHMDPGTAFEIGYFVAKGKPVVCYTQATGTLAERVLDWSATDRCPVGELRDKHGSLIEDFDLKENLMIEASVAHQQTYDMGHGVPAQQVLMCFDDFEAATKALASYLCGLI